jgi:hypothetical protein
MHKQRLQNAKASERLWKALERLQKGSGAGVENFGRDSSQVSI